jgi:hypothetical protein
VLRSALAIASDTNTYINNNANGVRERCELDRRGNCPVVNGRGLWMGHRRWRHQERRFVADHNYGRFGVAGRRHAQLANG